MQSFLYKRIGQPLAEGLTLLYAIFFARPSFQKLNLFLIRMGLRGVGVLNGETPYLSGETLLARRIVHALDRSDGIVLDVGANEGEFTDLVVGVSEKLRVLSFEPHPQTYQRLQRRFANNPRVQLLNCAVGRELGKISLFDRSSSDGSVFASVFRDAIEDLHHEDRANEHTVELISLDSLDIEGNIGLIKIDVEGFEMAVLQGTQNLIRNKQPKFLIIEFNEMNVASHTFLKDMCAELRGYKVERILPGGRTLELNNYRSWKHEIFAYQNLLFTNMR